MAGYHDEHVCHACVADRFLKAEIKNEGIRAKCVACGKHRPSLSIPGIAHRVEAAITEQFTPVRGDDGASFSTLVEEHAGVSQVVAEKITEWLSNTRGFSAVKDGEENVYDSSVSWDDGPLDRSRYQSGWARVQESVKQEARYYNGYAEKWLDDIFLRLDRQADWQGNRVVSTYSPSKMRTPFVRGRVAESEDELKRFLADPALEIGPPPPGKATAGRMNAAGVSVFYGAMDVETCRAETRPPVGSHVVFASFRLVRSVRILDLDALARIAVNGSIFDPDYMSRLERAAFLRRLDDEVSRPVMPREEAFGYLPTQIVAEYLSLRHRIDGVIYRSTQSGGKRDALGQRARNIVLFNHAARVGSVDQSGLEIEVDLGWFDEEDSDDRITIREKKLPPLRKPKAVKKLDPFEFDFVAPLQESVEQRPVTLRIVPNSIVVHEIRATDYAVNEREVSRWRYSDADLAKLPF